MRCWVAGQASRGLCVLLWFVLGKCVQGVQRPGHQTYVDSMQTHSLHMGMRLDKSMPLNIGWGAMWFKWRSHIVRVHHGPRG